MGLIKLVFSFLVSVFLSNKDEGNFKSHKFNPVKIAAVAIFYMSLLLNILMINKFAKLYTVLAKTCPSFTF